MTWRRDFQSLGFSIGFLASHNFTDICKCRANPSRTFHFTFTWSRKFYINSQLGKMFKNFVGWTNLHSGERSRFARWPPAAAAAKVWVWEEKNWTRPRCPELQPRSSRLRFGFSVSKNTFHHLLHMSLTGVCLFLHALTEKQRKSNKILSCVAEKKARRCLQGPGESGKDTRKRSS